eukprot:gene4587-5828_t
MRVTESQTTVYIELIPEAYPAELQLVNAVVEVEALGVESKEGWESGDSLSVTLGVADETGVNGQAHVRLATSYGLDFRSVDGAGNGIEFPTATFVATTELINDAISTVSVIFPNQVYNASVTLHGSVRNTNEIGSDSDTENTVIFPLQLKFSSLPSITTVTPALVSNQGGVRVAVQGPHLGSDVAACMVGEQVVASE